MSAPDEYRVPLATAGDELLEKGSRFLAIIEPAASREQIQTRLRTLRQEHSQATHVCWAWRLGHPAVEGRSDAGEPAGTAGTPMLQVLRGAGLSDVLAVVVRWYGGVKLGKGGLARAYAGVVRQAVEGLASERRRPVAILRVRVAYDRVGDLKRLVHPPRVEIAEESYGEQVEVKLRVWREELVDVEETLRGFAEIDFSGN